MDYNFSDPNCQRDLIDFLPESSVDVWDEDQRTNAPVLKSKDRGHVKSDVVAIKSDTGDIAFVAVGRTTVQKSAKTKLKTPSNGKKVMSRPDSLPKMIANPSAAGIDNFGYQTLSRDKPYTYDDTGFNYFSHLDRVNAPQYISPPRYVKLDGERPSTLSASARRGSSGDIPSTSQDQIFSQNSHYNQQPEFVEIPATRGRQKHKAATPGRKHLQEQKASSGQRSRASSRGSTHRLSNESQNASTPSTPHQPLTPTTPGQRSLQSEPGSNDQTVSNQSESSNTPARTRPSTERTTPRPPTSERSDNSTRTRPTSGRSSRRHSQDLDAIRPSTPPPHTGSSPTPKLPPLCKTCGQNHGVTENHEYDYVDEVDEDLMCDICLQPLVDPYDTVCGHTFCNICLKNYLRVKDICPVDRVELTNSNSDCWQSSLIMRKLVNKLKVTCPNEEFCKKSLQRCDLKDHLQDVCPGAVIRCSKSMYGCSHRCPRGQMEAHLEKCAYKNFTDKLSDLHPFSQDITVELFRPEGTAELGIMIVGGSDTPLHYVIIQEILSESIAGHDRRLQVGDILVEVNGESMFSVSHAEARSILMKPSSLMRFNLLRDTQSDDAANKENSDVMTNEKLSLLEETVCLVKPPLEQLGIRISSSEEGNKGVYIIELIPDQVAKTDGRLQVGDRILKIGDTNLTESTPEQAARVISSCDKEVKIHVRHLAAKSTAIMFNESVKESNSATTQKSKLRRSETFVVKPKIQKSSRTKKIISVIKSPRENLGIIVSGGNGSPRGNLPIFVQDVLPLSVLGKDKRIKRGDLLSEINSIKLTGLSHNQAIGILRESAQQREVTLVVYELDYEGKAEDEALWDELTSLHQNPSKWAPSWKMWLTASKDFSSMKELVLKRSSNSNFGFKISADVIDHSAPIPLFITHVSKNSPASKILKCGDEIVVINKRPVRDLQYIQVLNMIRSATHINLKIVSWPGSLH